MTRFVGRASNNADIAGAAGSPIPASLDDRSLRVIIVQQFDQHGDGRRRSGANLPERPCHVAPHFDVARCQAARVTRFTSNESALILPDGNNLPLDVRLEITSNEGDYHICSRPQNVSGEIPWSQHSSGRINFLPDDQPGCDLELSELVQRFEPLDEVDVRSFYDTIRQAGLEYGENFQCIERMWHEGHEIFAQLRIPEQLRREQMLGAVMELFAEQKLQAPPITEFPITKLADAMKFMSRAAYVGKIVVSMEGHSVHALPAKQYRAAEEGIYFVSGGASGFGLEVAKWLAAQGAQHLVLASRSGCKCEADRQAIEELRATGVDVVLDMLDIACPESVRASLSRFGDHWPALRGVVHAAGVLSDGSVASVKSWASSPLA